MEENTAISQLFQRYLDGQCTPGEVKLLLQYFDHAENDAILRKLIRQQVEKDPGSDLSSSHLLDSTYQRIELEIFSGASTTPVIPLWKRTWLRATVAAAIIIMLATTSFLLFYHQRETGLVVNKQHMLQGNDIAPGRDNAVLTLADGSRIVLDSAANGTLTNEGGIKVLKLNGQIAYNNAKSKDADGKVLYNTIATAKGNQYQLILSDGSKVWLNAASSIRFPASFSGNERKVEVTGEAYFEVTKNPSMPFRVIANGMEVEVLGTHFNVNAYEDEPEMNTTLVEGRVKINKANAMKILEPGQQARLSAGSTNIAVDHVDVAQVVAWKDGFFWFDNTDIHTLMRQVSRWYDVAVSFEGKVTEDGFSGKISRNVPLSKLLAILELYGVHFKMEGRKIIVMP